MLESRGEMAERTMKHVRGEKIWHRGLGSIFESTVELVARTRRRLEKSWKRGEELGGCFRIKTGGSLDLPCVGQGFPPPSYTWYKVKAKLLSSLFLILHPPPPPPPHKNYRIC
jgi:hypothetical protein